MDMILDAGTAEFQPGATIRGMVMWEPGESVDRLSWDFIWQTMGKGSTDRQSVSAGDLKVRPGDTEVRFALTAPHRPFSLSGKLLSIQWSLQVTARPGSRTLHIPISISPSGRPVQLSQSFAEEIDKRSMVRVGTRK